MAMLVGLSTNSTYAAGVLPPLLILGLGLGLIFGPGQNAATSAVRAREAGVASAMVNITQQIGGAIGLAAFSSLDAMATSNYLTAHAAAATETAAKSAATLVGYHFVFWVAAGLFLAGALLTAALFRTGPLPAGPDNQPALAH
jgi:hypothetical protein